MALAGGDPRQALTAKTRARHPQELRGQRLREIAYRRLLARIFATQPERWVVKGGVALLLRLDPNRTSNDIDLAYVAQAGEHAVALEALVEAAAHDLGDFFEFEIGRDQAEEVDPDHPLERARSVPVLARIGATTFAEFSIDLALPRGGDDVEVEWVQPEATLTGQPEVDQTEPVALLALPAQIADKLCALHERHGDGRYSSRARDLSDLAMIAQQKDSEGSRLIARVRREEARRRKAGTLIESLPKTLQLAEEQIADWSPRWKKATRDAPITFDEARAVAAAFLTPVLDGTAAGMRWNAATQTWSSRGGGRRRYSFHAGQRWIRAARRRAAAFGLTAGYVNRRTHSAFQNIGQADRRGGSRRAAIARCRPTPWLHRYCSGRRR